jgi:hypothetical protein
MNHIGTEARRRSAFYSAPLCLRGSKLRPKIVAKVKILGASPEDLYFSVLDGTRYASVLATGALTWPALTWRQYVVCEIPFSPSPSLG